MKMKPLGSETVVIKEIRIGKWYIQFGKVLTTYFTINDLLSGLRKALKIAKET